MADFERLRPKIERRVRLITTAHNTRGQWITVRFFVLGGDGKPQWCSKVIQQFNFQIPQQNGFQAARTANLNICEDLQHVTLPQLHAYLAGARSNIDEIDVPAGT